MATDTDHGLLEIRATAGTTRAKRVNVIITDGGTLDGQGGFALPAGVTSITGTANQVVASASTGAVTLSLPQSVHTGATPTFASLTLSGDLTVDTTTLKVDSTNNRVGVGTAAPSAPLHIKSAFASGFGHLCIQDSAASGSSATSYISYYGANAVRLGVWGYGRYAGAADPDVYFANEQTGGGLHFRNAAANLLSITNGGVLALYDAAAPAGGLADGVRLWSESVAGSSELKVRDEAGNVTTLSPHATDAPAWLYDWDMDTQPPHIARTANYYAGTVTFENRTRAARLQEMAFGGKSPASLPDERRRILHVETFAEYNARHGLREGDAGFLKAESWDANQEALEAQRVEERAA